MKLFSFLFMSILLSIRVSADAWEEDTVKSSIVKISTVFKVPNYLEPWNESIGRVTGSGCIIEGNRILTNAHVVANQTFIEVHKHGERKRYTARVEFVSHQADLALLRVDDEHFFDATVPLPLGELPFVQQKVAVYGYPDGGNTLSVTTGIVSRIEHNTYVHSGESFLAIQVDAAINPGNSGGPAMSDGKIVGVVMQIRNHSQNIGYLVPVPIITHFLRDVEDGIYDGFAQLGIATENLENTTLKHYYGLDKNVTGQLVLHVSYNDDAKGRVKPGDILTHIDGHAIQDDATVEFRPGEFTPFKYYVDKHQMGETVQLKLIRGTERIAVPVTLKHTVDEYLLVPTVRYDAKPDYLIFGGYVFVPLNANLIRASNRYGTLMPFVTEMPNEARREIVVLLKVLASDLSVGNYGLNLWPLDKINGAHYRDFTDFKNKMASFKGKYILLENALGFQIALDREQAESLGPTLLKRYNIPAGNDQ